MLQPIKERNCSDCDKSNQCADKQILKFAKEDKRQIQIEEREKKGSNKKLIFVILRHGDKFKHNFFIEYKKEEKGRYRGKCGCCISGGYQKERW